MASKEELDRLSLPCGNLEAGVRLCLIPRPLPGIPFGPFRGELSGRAYPKGESLRSRNVKSPPTVAVATPRIGRAPSCRFTPNRGRYVVKISLANSREPNTAPS